MFDKLRKSWKTTLAGAIVALLPVLGPQFGLTASQIDTLQTAAVAVGLASAKDSNVTGGTKRQ